MLQIIDGVKYGQTIPLSDLVPVESATKHFMVVTFLALLEMALLRMIKVYQAGRFEPVYITCMIREATLDDTKKMIIGREAKMVEVINGTT